MKITQTIELDDNDRLTVERFLKLTDKISEITGGTMEEVFTYFANQAEFDNDGNFSIGALHQIDDMR